MFSFYFGLRSALNWRGIHWNLRRGSWRSCDEVWCLEGILKVALNSRFNVWSEHGFCKECGWCGRDSANSHAFCVAIWRKECVSQWFFHTVLNFVDCFMNVVMFLLECFSLILLISLDVSFGLKGGWSFYRCRQWKVVQLCFK